MVPFYKKKFKEKEGYRRKLLLIRWKAISREYLQPLSATYDILLKQTFRWTHRHNSPCEYKKVVCTISKQVVCTVHTTIALTGKSNVYMRHFCIFNFMYIYLLFEDKNLLKQCRILCHLINWKIWKEVCTIRLYLHDYIAQTRKY